MTPPALKGEIEGPVPVRDVVEGAIEPEDADRDDETRSFSSVDGEWIARVVGSGRSGSLPDSGAAILLVAFSRASEPGAFLREVLTAGSSLRDLEDGDLETLLERAAPYRDGVPSRGQGGAQPTPG
jgi:hypothetical protein